MCPAEVPDGRQRGYIIPIGGAEDKVPEAEILNHFVDLCGGRRARLTVIPTASQLAETGDSYRRLFHDIGARDVDVLKIESREDGSSERYIAALEEADGVFVTGGNQLRLSSIIGGTPLAQALRRANAGGLHVAGTSAGAAFIPEHMIAHGDSGPTPRAAMVQLAPGFGLTNKAIIDQHFRERDRIGRLLTALAYNPFAVGLGLDEDTAAFIGPDNVLEVYGSGAITVVDPSELSKSTIDQVEPGSPVSLVGVKLHVLARGGRFDLDSRQASV
jgi:cyanophycinase